MKKTVVLSFMLMAAVIGLEGCGKKSTNEELINLEPMPAAQDTTVIAEPTLDLQPVQEETPPVISTPVQPVQPAMVTGYRVQIFAFNDMASANNAIKSAQPKFDFPLYVDFHEGLYKVRVGNFLNKNEAEHYRAMAVNKGYADAWVVECQIENR